MELLVVVAAVAALAFVVRVSLDAPVARRVFPVLMLALAVRLVVHVVLQRGALIGYGGDNLWYELWAVDIADQWKLDGFSYVTADSAGRPFSVALPSNLLAVIVYLCGGPAPVACTAFVGLLACVLCVIMYRFARLVGADDRAAFRLLVVLAFMPAFLLHTSDTFKDGFNALFVVASLYVGVSLVRRFTFAKLLVLVPLLWALWNVRPYMTFLCLLPLAVGIIAPKRVISLRTLFAVTVAAVLLAFMPEVVVDNGPVEMMREQMDYAQSQAVQRANSTPRVWWRQGSGVQFDDGGNTWNSLGPRLVYTVLSPFPWTPGGFALQFSKIDTCLWYLLLAAAVVGARRLWRRERGAVLVLLLFVVPATVAYATTMSNMGLIFRQRIPVVMVTSLLSAVAWTRSSPGEPDPVDTPPDALPEPEEAPRRAVLT
ncbi:hypothetical protein [Sphaerisporangium fuscum]|uniref:hypothetical protein n=1 Tax=Sphaerisporangium fuscum TaxID=2835868 RepID=UPI001BDBE579|nr:hypothetical protein [Sphaerisporangium fuscum]